MSASALTLRARHRISNKLEFDRVFKAKARKHVGPLTIFAMPNGLPHLRYGLSVPRRVGNAVTRNRIKRLLREALRHNQHDLPSAPDGGGYDWLIAVRPHEAMTLEQYADALRNAAAGLDHVWRKRAHKNDG
ncbi:MAG: ribonuclease P protein component [Phycisphaerales bacterium]|nr:ribonuclease P protein component [Phycisphaerales bacterium]